MNTSYCVMSGRKVMYTLRIDELSPELYESDKALLTWAFITAWNPLPEILSKSENDERNKQLEKEIGERSLKYKKGLGKADDGSWSEESYFIENISIVEALELGKLYGQKAIVMGERGMPAELLVLQNRS